MDEDKEGFRKGGFRTRGMRNRRDVGQEGCRKSGMLDSWDAGPRELGMPERKDARKKGYGKRGVQERRDMGKVGFKR